MRMHRLKQGSSSNWVLRRGNLVRRAATVALVVLVAAAMATTVSGCVGPGDPPGHLGKDGPYDHQGSDGPLPPGRLSGRVSAVNWSTKAVDSGTGGDLHPLEGATISLVPGPNGQEPLTAVTDGDGCFSFSGLHPGAYRLEAAAEGFQGYRSDTALFVVSGEEHSEEITLFPCANGRPTASLTLGSASGPFPYSQPVSIYATDSRNYTVSAMTWEVVDSQRGTVVGDVPTRSSTPGSPPLSYQFVPPYPGSFEVRLRLTNSGLNQPEDPAVDAATDEAAAIIKAVNLPPKAYPSIASLSSLRQDGAAAAGSLDDGGAATPGMQVVTVGSGIYLRAWATDANMPSPELYNPRPGVSNPFGKSHDFRQTQFGWGWQLQYRSFQDGAIWEEVSPLLSGVGSQLASFIPDRPGVYRAWLTANDNDPAGALSGWPAPVVAYVLEEEDAYVGQGTCRSCHADIAAQVEAAGHAASCEACHGPGALHLEGLPGQEGPGPISVTHDAELCGSCHGAEYEEWLRSRHSDGYAYGYAEIAQPLLLNCAKCHYPDGYATAIERAQAGDQSFSAVDFLRQGPDGRAQPDFDQLPPADGPGITCQACHDPHGLDDGGLRAGSPGEACGTCHEIKWQNVLLLGNAGQVGSAYHSPGSDYPVDNPHNTPDGCVLCHMRGNEDNRSVAGHSLRMRDGDELNLAPCSSCHDQSAQDFNIGELQEQVRYKWMELGELLAGANHGQLPGYRPGDKCATCHRGGTMPFDDDPLMVLENAYTNYKLIMNDRSWGVHNPGYTRQLLDDTIKMLKDYITKE